MIYLYIFDMGGVVTNNSMSVEAGVELSMASDKAGEDLDALVAGVIDSDEFLRRRAAGTGEEIARDLLTRTFQPVPDTEVLELARALKKTSRVVVGTNTIAPHYDIHFRNGDYGIFDTVYASYLIGLAKPDPAFYLHILKEENRTPEETVFIDDKEANVAAARKIGIHGFVFRDAKTLAKDFAKFRVNSG
ncbi:MAG: HAD family phosphatase [Spirochaetales bacterium]|jgi:glucose-1-phosphatase|nr:HAD family phosphatase [Spirochaetales bacterium]